MNGKTDLTKEKVAERKALKEKHWQEWELFKKEYMHELETLKAEHEALDKKNHALEKEFNQRWWAIRNKHQLERKALGYEDKRIFEDASIICEELGVYDQHLILNEPQGLWCKVGDYDVDKDDICADYTCCFDLEEAYCKNCPRLLGKPIYAFEDKF